MLSLVFTLSYADSCKQNKVYDKLCESQIRTAKIFLNAFEVNAQKAKIMLDMLKPFLEHIKNSSNLELIKATENMFERRKTRVTNSENAVRTARLHVKAAKAGNVVFDKIARNYINSNNYAKDEDNSNVEIVNINKCDELFNSQVRANEILLNFFQEWLKLAKNNLKQQEEEYNSIKTQPANPGDEEIKLENINLKISETTVRLIEAKVELAKACLKAAKDHNIVFEEIAKTLPKKPLFTFNVYGDINKMNEKFTIKFYNRIIKFLKDELKNSKNEIKSLQSYIKKVESNSKGNAEMIDVLKARLKVSEIQTDIYKLSEEQAGQQLKELKDN